MSSLKDAANAAGFAFYNTFAPRGTVTRELPADPWGALAGRFDRTWVLTIPRNTKRQEFMRQQLARLPFEFITGVDGKTLDRHDPRLSRQGSVNRMGRELLPNEYACSLSHASMYRKLLDSDAQSALIFEDDAVFDPRVAGRLSAVLSRLPDDWELLYLGYRNGELRGIVTELLAPLGLADQTRPGLSRTVCRGLRTAAAHDFAHAYAVSREGARKLLESNTPATHTADGLMLELVLAGKLKAYATVPKFFHQQESLGSSIHVKD